MNDTEQNLACPKCGVRCSDKESLEFHVGNPFHDQDGPAHPVPTPVESELRKQLLVLPIHYLKSVTEKDMHLDSETIDKLMQLFATYLQTTNCPLNVTIDGKAAKDVGLFTGEELQAAVQAARIDELEELNKNPYWSMEDVKERIKQLKKGGER